MMMLRGLLLISIVLSPVISTRDVRGSTVRIRQLKQDKKEAKLKKKKCKEPKKKKRVRDRDLYTQITHNQDISSSIRAPVSAPVKARIVLTRNLKSGHNHGTDTTQDNNSNETDYEYWDCNDEDEFLYPSVSPSTSASPSTSVSPSISPSRSNPPSRDTSVSPSDSPSREPSVSISNSPSRDPIIFHEPSVSPSDLLSRKPSVSPSDSLSHEPSVSPSDSPSGEPSLSPSSPGCMAFKKGEVFKTSIEMTVDFQYELVRTQDTDLTTVLGALQEALALYLVLELLGCDITTNSRRLESASVILGLDARIMSASGGQRQLQTDGIDMSTIHGQNSASCGNEDPGTTCSVMDGVFKLYLRENSVDTSKNQARTAALTSIQKGMDEDKFIGNDIIKTKYIGISMVQSDVKNDDNFGDNLNGAQASGTQTLEDNDKISAMGIGLIAVVAVGTALVGVVAVRRRKDTRLRTHELYQEDESTIITRLSKLNPMSSKGFINDDQETVDMSTLSSTTSSNWRKSRNAHVYGEDDSVLTRPTNSNESIIDDLQQIEEERRMDVSPDMHHDEQDLVNVHHCTSLTCNLCATKNDTTFIASTYLTTVRERSPTPMSLGKREYRADDTVDF